MATEKQAALIVRLAIKAGKITPQQASQCRLYALTLSQADTKHHIDSLNVAVGFDRRHSPATDSQRAFILDLETKVHGRWQTAHSERLTYAEADSRIQLLRKQLAGQTAAPVLDIFTRKAI